MSERRIWWHSQNLNKRQHGPRGPMWRNGRAWLRLCSRTCFQVEWVLFRKDSWLSLEIEVNRTFGDDADLAAHIRLPYLGALYWEAQGIFPSWLRKSLPEGRRIGLQVWGEFLTIRLWAMDPATSWGEDENRWWQEISWDWKDTLLGKQEHKKEILQDWQPITIPMPEGSYEAKYQVIRRTWWRKRWPGKIVREESDIDLVKGVPVPGKGENSWDCGEDAIMGMGGPPDAAGAIAAVVRAALETRERYGGSVGWQPARRTR